MVQSADLVLNLKLALQNDGQGSSDFDLNPDVVLPKNRVLKPAAVMIAVINNPHNPSVILTKRSSTLRHHPGQIAFPGGKADENDVSPIATAQREAKEELDLDVEETSIIGTLPKHETITGFTVTPVVALIEDPKPYVLELGEVAEVFTTPLSFLLNPENFQIQSRKWQGVQRYYYVVPFGPYYIWGATARILRGFADRVSHA